jgi:hypothetical protein
MKTPIITFRKEKFKKLVLPGFEGATISNVFTFVVKGFSKGVLVTRASSIAFNLLMATRS